MEIIVHYPEDKHSLNTLCEKIAIQHGEFVYFYLDRTDLTTEQKVAILEGIEGMSK